MSNAEAKLFELMGNIDYKLQLLEVFNLNYLEKQIIENEDLVLTDYYDQEGVLKSGVNRIKPENEKGLKWTLEQAIKYLKEDLRACFDNCYTIFKDFEKLSESKQLALILLCFSVNKDKNKFDSFIELFNKRKYAKASIEIFNTNWAFKNKNKAIKIARLIVEE